MTTKNGAVLNSETEFSKLSAKIKVNGPNKTAHCSSISLRVFVICNFAKVFFSPFLEEEFIGLFLKWCFPKSVAASNCKLASYSVQDHVLKNHTIKTSPAERIEEHIIQCMQHPGCYSSNFYRKHRLCE